MRQVEWHFKVSTEPTNPPVSTAEAKAHLRVTHSDDDTYIDGLVKAARRVTERSSGRALITQTIDTYLDRFPSTPIYLPRSPVSAVTHVKYYDTSDTLQTLVVDTDYQVDLLDEPVRIVPAYGTTWPTTRDRLSAVQIQSVHGYGAAASNVNEDLVHAVKLLLGHWYEHREPVTIEGVPRAVSLSFNALVTHNRIVMPPMF